MQTEAEVLKKKKTVKVHDEHTSKDRNATKKIKKRIWLNRFLLFTLYSVTVLK